MRAATRAATDPATCLQHGLQDKLQQTPQPVCHSSRNSVLPSSPWREAALASSAAADADARFDSQATRSCRRCCRMRCCFNGRCCCRSACCCCNGVPATSAVAAFLATVLQPHDPLLLQQYQLLQYQLLLQHQLLPLFPLLIIIRSRCNLSRCCSSCSPSPRCNRRTQAAPATRLPSVADLGGQGPRWTWT